MSKLRHMAVLAFLLAGVSCALAAEDHWAYRPLAVSPQPPASSPGTHPIDAFIRAKLSEHRLKPSMAADPRTWLRRVSFNLTGLPPTPEEMRAFLADAAPGARERVVDRLLASPRHGERWARHWMDAAHFAESHGHDQDRIRTNAWPYRDYLIRSFNEDKPYARFVEEQVAGDVLFPGDPQATVALGFIAAGPWDESSLRDIREDTIDRQIGRYLDRDDMLTTVMQTFTSSTVQCARCHDHKFDPISQRDYYALQAVFAGVDRADRVYDEDAKVHARRQELLRQRRVLEQRGPAFSVLLKEPAVQREVAAAEKSLLAELAAFTVLVPDSFSSSNGTTFKRLEDHSLLAGGPRPEKDVYVVTARTSERAITAVRLELFADDALPQRGPGRQDNGNLHLSEFKLLAQPGCGGEPAPVQIGRAAADFNQQGWTVEQAIDGKEKTAWGIFPQVGRDHHAVFELKENLGFDCGTTLIFVLEQNHGGGHLLGRFRFSISTSPRPVRTRSLPETVAKILGTPTGRRTEEQQRDLAAFVLKDRIERDLAALPKPSRVYAAASDFEPDGGLKPAGGPRLVQMLRRGDIHKPVEVAQPGALSCVAGVPARFELTDPSDEGARRAALARWLTHRDNPLTWRSIVNRVWHHHFGRGLVATPNDFGKAGSAPSHPELLDWLAAWFRDDAKGSLKQLHRLIVTSEAYRQASQHSVIGKSVRGATKAGFPTDSLNTDSLISEYSRLDPDNRLLWRMNRTRLDAEQVRDAILQISGALDLRMGGVGDMQFDLQPGHHVTPRVDYTKFDVAGDASRRRSVYRFLFRTLPDPFMDALDCPAGDQLTPARNASVTVQQALSMWNNAFVAHYAEVFARRVESAAKSPRQQVESACELVWCRPPSRTERRELVRFVEKHGLANLCRLLLNSNEFMFVN